MDDRLKRFDRLERYEGYLRYMQLMDHMDMMEGICETSISRLSTSPPQYAEPSKRTSVVRRMRLDSDTAKVSEEEGINEENYDSDVEDSDSDFSQSNEPSKKKPSVNFENPYRGLKDADNPIETMTDVDFLNSYKFSKKTIYDIMELIKSGLIKHSNRGSPVPPLMALIITLRYFTTGSIQKNAMNGVSQATISRIIARVTNLIMPLQSRFIKFPDKTEVEKNKMKFYERGKFPETVGCIGSTHVGVRVKESRECNAGYVNEKGYHSVRVQIHQLMLEDTERMVSYKTAIMKNKSGIQGKTVMDVGAGTGILSLFCAMAGAKKVYAVEASNLAIIAKNVIKENKMEHIVEVIHSKVEDFTLPNDEKVDIIVSEWMGFYLLHEGMLDSVFYARDKFLKSTGSMFPESATVYVAPCSVPSLYDFWENIHECSMKSVSSVLRKNKSDKPEVMKVNEEHLMGEKTALCWIDLKEDTIADLNCYSMKHIIGASKSGRYQGMCIWFDCQFPTLSEDNNDDPIRLCTAPWSPITHWKQTVIVLPDEQLLEKGEPIGWELVMKRSEETSRRYNLQLTLLDPETEIHPMPCTCYMTKCIVIKKFLEQHPNGEEPFGKIDENEDDSCDDVE